MASKPGTMSNSKNIDDRHRFFLRELVQLEELMNLASTIELFARCLLDETPRCAYAFRFHKYFVRNMRSLRQRLFC